MGKVELNYDFYPIMQRLLVLALLIFNPLIAKEIVFWHAFEGFLEKKFSEIVDDFNHQSGNYQIKLVYKGNYKETFESGFKACQEGQPPHILQVYEVATQTMTLNRQFFKPVDELMRYYYKKFDPAVYIDVVRDFYSTSDGKMYSLPWNASTGILFYNKKIFAEVGLDPESPPKTWQDLEVFGYKLTKAGYTGFVTAWPAAYHLEHLCSLHNIPFATHQNGFEGLSARLIFNSPLPLMHLTKLVKWQKEGIFSYQGRFTNEPEKYFAEGKGAILLQGANRLPILKKMTQDPIGVGFMPYWQEVEGAPFSLNIGGSSFWVLSGFDDETYRGIAQFFAYLSMTEVQAYWHQETGYLPITESAYYLTKKNKFYENNPAQEIAVLEVMSRKSTPNTKGVRLGNYPVIRDKIIDNLEKAFEGKLSPKEALDQAILEGNLLLEEFEKSQIKNSP